LSASRPEPGGAATPVAPPAAGGFAAPRSAADLFFTFTRLALQGFGGVLAVAQRVLCDERGWLSRTQFVELLAFAQVLPGPNVCNVALMVGDRYFGWRGAFAALSGMMALPLVIVMLVAVVHGSFAGHPVVAGALKGMGAVAAGLILGTALKLAEGLAGNPSGRVANALFALAAFAGVALLRLPLVVVLLALGPPACLYAAFRIARGAGAGGVA